MAVPYSMHKFPIPGSKNFRVSEDRDDSSHTLSPSPQPVGAEVLADTDLFVTETANQVPTQNGSARDPPPPKAALFDAAALLDPKGKQRSRKEEKPSSSNQAGSSAAEMDQHSGPGLGSLIENLHGVENRVDAPRKRRKVSPEPEESDEKKRTLGPIASSGLMSGFLQEQRQEAMNNAVHTPTSDVVDLTLGECNIIPSDARTYSLIVPKTLALLVSMSFRLLSFLRLNLVDLFNPSNEVWNR
jgi:hypothetical protein